MSQTLAREDLDPAGDLSELEELPASEFTSLPPAQTRRRSRDSLRPPRISRPPRFSAAECDEEVTTSWIVDQHAAPEEVHAAEEALARSWIGFGLAIAVVLAAVFLSLV